MESNYRDGPTGHKNLKCTNLCDSSFTVLAFLPLHMDEEG